MRIASVILDIPTQSLDSAYSYLVPDDAGEVEVGCAVLVPFGGRQSIGYVVKLEDCDNLADHFSEISIDPDKLKFLIKSVSRSFFDEQAAECAVFLSETYIAPLSSCIKLFTPPGGTPKMVRRGAAWWVEEPKIGPVDDRWVRLTPAANDFEPKQNAHKQKRVLQALQSGELRVAELALEFGGIATTLKALEKKGVISIESRRRMRGEIKHHVVSLPQSPPAPDLTEEQVQALHVIQEAQEKHDGQVVVVDGVTGSGKTEIYLRAIEETLKEGRGALVLVPEISLTPQTVARFRGRFGDSVAVLHSRLGQGERYDQWERIKSGEARVVVGARSALFAPIRPLGLIVIDEEHEGSYKQDTSPRYNARDVASWMVEQHQATLVLGSATPSIEALHRCEIEEKWNRVELAQRVNGRPLPQVEVVDMTHEFGGGHRSMFSRNLIAALHKTLEADQKAVLLLNQRGFAKFLLCRECGYVPTCESCETSLTYHEIGQTLVCHHCGYKEPAPPRCPECESPYLKKFGAGTQRVESELHQVLSDVEARVIRMDSDTTSKKGAHEALLEKFAAPGAAVLLGTQMIAKGLDFDDVTLVGVINADTMLKLPDFRSGERTFNLIEQVAGRAGRADLPGYVLVQTYWPESIAIRAAAHYKREAFLEDELPKRKILGYPPYVRLANVLIWGEDVEQVKEVASELSASIDSAVKSKNNDEWKVLSATPCVLSKVRNAYRWHILVKAPLQDDISEVLLPIFRTRKVHKKVNVAVDVDPFDLL